MFTISHKIIRIFSINYYLFSVKVSLFFVPNIRYKRIRKIYNLNSLCLFELIVLFKFTQLIYHTIT